MLCSLNTEEWELLYSQWGMKHSLTQLAVARYVYPYTMWQWYLLNAAPDNSAVWILEGNNEGYRIQKFEVETEELPPLETEAEKDNYYLPEKVLKICERMTKSVLF